jgi:hypothetical protein
MTVLALAVCVLVIGLMGLLSVRINPKSFDDD